MSVYLINCLPSPLHHWKTPYEILNNTPLDYSKIKMFGCLPYATNTQPLHDKFTARIAKCIFIGYVPSQTSYKLYDVTTHKVFSSLYVMFCEEVFPFHGKIDSDHNPTPLPIPFFDSDKALPTSNLPNTTSDNLTDHTTSIEPHDHTLKEPTTLHQTSS